MSRLFVKIPESGEIKDFGHFISLFTGADPLFRKLRQVEDLEESGDFKVLSGKKGKRKPREKTFDKAVHLCYNILNYSGEVWRGHFGYRSGAGDRGLWSA